jgi:hypothetical protein
LPQKHFLVDDWKFGFVVLATSVGHQWHGGNDELRSKMLSDQLNQKAITISFNFTI